MMEESESKSSSSGEDALVDMDTSPSCVMTTNDDTSLYCWGSTSRGQLGLGGIEEEQITTPTELKFCHGRRIRSIVCGEQHSVLLSQSGSVYACGCNDYGQLGLSTATKKPGNYCVTL